MFNNYLYFKGLLYFWEEMIMMALLHMAGLENSECIWKIQRKPEVAVCLPWSKEEEGAYIFGMKQVLVLRKGTLARRILLRLRASSNYLKK
jgi:hypothetical protein